jgi:hypothetical protein
MVLYHGTDENSAKYFLQGGVLDAIRADFLKIDGPPGFFLSYARVDAEFFAVRHGRGVVIQYLLTDKAFDGLVAVGALRQPIPIGQRSPRFSADELMIPVGAFVEFN